MTTTLLWLCTVAWVPITLADDTEPTGETPAEEPAAEEAPAEEPAAEEAPAEEAPAEKAPAEEPATEEPAAEEAPAADRPTLLDDPPPDARQQAREAALRRAAEADAAAAAAAEAVVEAAPADPAAAEPDPWSPTMAPVGFRIGTPMPIDLAGTRTVLIVNPGDQVLVQTAPSVSLNLGKYGFEAELPTVLETGPGGQFIGGIGALNTGHWFRFHGAHKMTYHAIGAKIGAALVPRRYRVDSWGSIHHETLNTFSTQLGWHVQWNPDAPVGIRILMGLSTIPQGRLGIFPAVELGFTKAVPLGDTTWLILEQDLVTDISPASFRPMVRWEINDGMLDLGLQLPWGSWVGDGAGPASVQVITQYQLLF